MTRRLSYPEPWAEFVRRLGGVVAAAAACGCNRVQLWRWAHGQEAPGEIVQKHVNALARRRGLEEPFPALTAAE